MVGSLSLDPPNKACYTCGMEATQIKRNLSELRAVADELAPPQPMIHAAIVAVIDALPSIGKDAEMTQGPRYNYRSIEAILPHVKKVFAEHGVHPTAKHHLVTDEQISTAKGGAMTRVVVRSTFKFYAVDGSYVETTTYGEARDAGDKAFNKAETAAWKYALIETLCIAEGDDPDHYNPSAGAPVVYENFEALRALAPELREAGLDADVKAWASEHGIDMVAGRDEAGMARVVVKARELLADAAAADAEALAENEADAERLPH